MVQQFLLLVYVCAFPVKCGGYSSVYLRSRKGGASFSNTQSFYILFLLHVLSFFDFFLFLFSVSNETKLLYLINSKKKFFFSSLHSKLVVCIVTVSITARQLGIVIEEKLNKNLINYEDYVYDIFIQKQ